MEKIVSLKDDTKVTIRDMQKEDVEKSFQFFKDLPEQDRMYLRDDVTKRKVVENRIKRMLDGEVIRIIAVVDDEIVGDGALELKGLGWQEHVGEMRLILAKSFQKRGLGMVMARELYFIATQRNLEKIIVQMMRPQIAAQKIFRKLGFHEEVVMPEFVKDLNGHRQDLIQMSCNLTEMKEKLEQFFFDTDWRSHR